VVCGGSADLGQPLGHSRIYSTSVMEPSRSAAAGQSASPVHVAVLLAGDGVAARLRGKVHHTFHRQAVFVHVDEFVHMPCLPTVPAMRVVAYRSPRFIRGHSKRGPFTQAHRTAGGARLSTALRIVGNPDYSRADRWPVRMFMHRPRSR
jgi:hypothetical protein